MWKEMGGKDEREGKSGRVKEKGGGRGRREERRRGWGENHGRRSKTEGGGKGIMRNGGEGKAEEWQVEIPERI